MFFFPPKNYNESPKAPLTGIVLYSLIVFFFGAVSCDEICTMVSVIEKIAAVMKGLGTYNRQFQVLTAYFYER